METSLWGRFDLSAGEARKLVTRQAAWAGVSGVALAGIQLVTRVFHAPPDIWDVALFLSLAVAIGSLVSGPPRLYLLPLLIVVVVGVTLGLEWLGVPAPLAAGAAAGLGVGRGTALQRAESVLAGSAGTMVAVTIAGSVPTSGLVATLLVGAAAGLGASQALIPAALRFQAYQRIPNPGTVKATLAAPYRPPCQRAWSLDQEIAARAPDREVRDGLGEVGAWVYRLALTLQTLDEDLGRIDPVSIAARRADLDADPITDPFIRERRAGTAQHLDRLLEHRTVLVRERARTASLQEYALAYLEEARAGLAVAQRQPGDTSPERLGVVLERLRAHAAETHARRDTRRELGSMT